MTTTTEHGTWNREVVLSHGAGTIFVPSCECGWQGSPTYSRAQADAECIEHKPQG